MDDSKVETVERIYVEAYELKTGGFRAVAAQMSHNNNVVGEPLRSLVCDDLLQAKFCGRRLADQFINGRPVRSGSYRTNERNRWRCNYFFNR